VTHHYITKQFAQLATVLGKTRVAVLYKLFAKLSWRFELTRLEQGDQVV